MKNKKRKKRFSEQEVFDAGFKAGCLVTSMAFIDALMKTVLKKDKRRKEVKKK